MNPNELVASLLPKKMSQAKRDELAEEILVDGECMTVEVAEPPAGGPGSGKPVDEMPWLVGGGHYDKAAELAKWETGQGPALAASIASAQQNAARPTAAPASSPRAAATASLGIRETPVAQDDEPPF